MGVFEDFLSRCVADCVEAREAREYPSAEAARLEAQRDDAASLERDEREGRYREDAPNGAQQTPEGE